MFTKRTTIAVDSSIIEKIKSTQWRFFSIWLMIRSVLEAIAEWKLACNEKWEWVSSANVNIDTNLKQEKKQSGSVEYSVQPIPERAQWAIFQYQQRWNLNYPTDISKDLASYREELKISYGTDWQKDVVDSIIWLKFGNWYNWGDLKAIPDMYEPSLYNFFKWKWFDHLAEQIDSLIQDVINIDNTEDKEEEYESDLNYAD